MTDALSLLFLLTSITVILTPGQDLVLVMSRSVSQGWRAGVATAAGVSCGLIGHTLLAALGLGAILAASQKLYFTVKLVGAIYLVYLGIKLLHGKGSQVKLHGLPALPLSRLFLQGALSNLSNPKIAIFYFSFLPQFVPLQDTNPTRELLVLGLAFGALTFLVKGPIGYAAGQLSGWLRSRPSVLQGFNRASGCVLVGLGLKLAFERRS